MDYLIDGNNFSKSAEKPSKEEFNNNIRTPAYGDTLKIVLSEGDEFKSRSDSIVSYSGSIKTSTNTTRSTWKSIASFKNYPVTRILCEEDKGVVNLSSPLPGEIFDVKKELGEMKIQSLAFMGVPESFSINLKTSEIFKNKSLGTVTVNRQESDGLNRVFIYGFSGINILELNENERTHVREDYIAAIGENITYKREKKSGRLKSKILESRDRPPSVILTGPGKIYMHASSPFKFNRIMEKIDSYF